MTFSEFGRRVNQNASNVLLLGGGLKKQSVLNDAPDLDQGDLKYQLDFRSVYTTVLRGWPQADDTAILGNH